MAIKAATNPAVRVVLYEGAGSDPLPEDERYETMLALLEGGFSVTRTATGADRRVSSADDRALLVLGRFDDPQSFDTASLDTDVPIHIRDLTDMDAEAAVNTAGEVAAAAVSAGERDASEYWKPWFPVIDYDRCTNCMQCLSFCLFDVYGVDGDKQIEVRNQTNCKTDCPACSRVCPEVAILFPKYRNGPINGDEVSQDDVQREKMKVDISSLLGGDIYAALRNRNEKAKSRFAKERDEDKALKERKRCLTKLAERFDIPAEALEALPTMSEIQARASAAFAKAEEARSAAGGGAEAGGSA